MYGGIDRHVAVCAGVLPEIEAAAAAVALYGVAHCCVGVQLPTGRPLPATLALRLLDVTPPGPGPQPGACTSWDVVSERSPLHSHW